MYRILYKGEVLSLEEEVKYVKEVGGVYVRSSREDAESVSVRGELYPISEIIVDDKGYDFLREIVMEVSHLKRVLNPVDSLDFGDSLRELLTAVVGSDFSMKYQPLSGVSGIINMGLSSIGIPQPYKVDNEYGTEVLVPLGVDEEGIVIFYERKEGYSLGAEVSYQGKHYRSLKDKNLDVPGDSDYWGEIL